MNGPKASRGSLTVIVLVSPQKVEKMLKLVRIMYVPRQLTVA